MRSRRSLFAIPYVVWMALFVVAPIIMVVIYAFTTADFAPTVSNFVGMGTYLSIFTRSFQLAIIATVICLLIGYPISYMMAKEGPRFQRLATVLIMLPMWVNFLLRTYAWMSILENNGLLNQFFDAIGLFDLINGIFGTDIEYFRMIRTQGAVVLGMVYNYLPFMILPIYSVIVKLDNSLVEAARDLGANSATVFRKVMSTEDTIQEFAPALRTDAQAKALKTALQMLGDLTGFDISYFDFDGAGYVKTATEVSSDNSALMRNIRRHEQALEGAIAGICRAAMAASRSLGAELPEEGDVRVTFDDSIITDTSAEKQQNMAEVAAGLMEAWEYHAKWYGEDESAGRKHAATRGALVRTSAATSFSV